MKQFKPHPKRLIAVFFYCLTIALCTTPEVRADLRWKNVGPGGGGWIQSIAADPQDPDTVYLGCDVGGFYKSTDGGANWTISNSGLTDFFVESIAVHPSDRKTILLGTQGGVFRSADGGASWEARRSGFPALQSAAYSAPIGAVAFDPRNPAVVYAGIGRPRRNNSGKGHIYKSTDTGETWTLCTSATTFDPAAIIEDIEVAADGSFVMAATNKGVYRSDDGGATWASANTGLPSTEVREIAIAKGQPEILYCTLRTTARGDAAWNGGVFRSDNGGRSWQARSTGLPQVVASAKQPAKMGSHWKEIVVDPTNADVAYVGGQSWGTPGIFKTTDGGAHWTHVVADTQSDNVKDKGWLQWGASVECLTISPVNSDRLWYGTTGYVLSTDNGGTTWTQRYTRMNPDGTWAGNGLEVTALNDIIADPHHANRVFFAYMDLGLLVSNNNGQSMRRVSQGMREEFQRNAFTVAFDPADEKTLWAGTGLWNPNRGEICRSADGGNTWTPVGTPATGLPDGQNRIILVDPTSAPGQRTLYTTSDEHGVFKSTDGGSSWKELTAGLPDARKKPRGLLMNPKDTKHLRLALAGTPQNRGSIWESHDSGAIWKQVSDHSPFFDVQDLKADPLNFDTLYLAQRTFVDRSTKPNKIYPGGLFKSVDGGKSWQQAFDYKFVSSIAIDPAQPGTLYLGTLDYLFHDENRAAGVWKSIDEGKSWKQESQGLTLPNITSLHATSSHLWAGTNGNSVFVTPTK